MSIPLQNARPAPVTTIARTLSSRSAAHIASPSSFSIWSVTALRWSGRFRVTVTTPPSTSTRIVS